MDADWKCKECGELNPDEVEFCVNCRTDRENKAQSAPQNARADTVACSSTSLNDEWKCQECGYLNPSELDFCVNCRTSPQKISHAEHKTAAEELTPTREPDKRRRNDQRRECMSDHKTECAALMDACTPVLYRNNAFRITGLTVDATSRDIKRRIDDLKHAGEMGDGENEHTHAYAIAPPPSIEQIREAAQLLQDPERRLVDEFFWFWPLKWGDSKTDPAISAMINGDTTTPFKQWMSILQGASIGKGTHAARIRETDTTAIIVAKHNLAVMYHLVALDSEHHALSGEIAPEELKTIEKYWRTSFQWWEELTSDEHYWSMVSDRIRKIDDPRLTTGYARRMKACLPEALDKINAMLAISFAEKGKMGLVEKHVQYMKDTHQGLDNIEKTLSAVTTPLKKRIQSNLEHAKAAAKRTPKQAVKYADDLVNAVTDPIKIIKMILPEQDHDRIDLCDSAAEACLECQLAYARETKDWAKCLPILDAALGFAVSQETRERISTNRKTVASNHAFDKHLGPVLDKLKEIKARSSIAEAVQAVESTIVPQLSKIERMPNIDSETYADCADAVASVVRDISVAAYNEGDDLPLANKAIDLAIKIARSANARERLIKDKAQLGEIKAKSERHNAKVEMRSDVVEVTSESVTYKGKRLSAKDLIGIRFGIYLHSTNGIRDTTSYLICLTTGKDEISIECNRFMRSEEKVRADFNNILESLFHHVIPGIVKRVAERVCKGIPTHVGGCKLTANGVEFSTGVLMWKKEHYVPWSDVRFNTSQGTLYISSAKDRKASESCALRDAWNAVIFEHIGAAIVKMKANG